MARVSITIALLLSALMSVVPATGVTVYVPDVADRALSLEEEGLKHATPAVTPQAVREMNEWRSPIGFLCLDGARSVYWFASSEPYFEVRGNELRVMVPGGELATVRMNPEHTYVILPVERLPEGARTVILHTVPVYEVPNIGAEKGPWFIKYLDVAILHNGTVYRLVSYPVEAGTLEIKTERQTFLSRAIGLMDRYDLLVRLEINRDTIAFDLVKSDGSSAYRVVCDLRTGRAWRESLPPEDSRRLIEIARKDLRVEEAAGNPVTGWIVYDATEGKIVLLTDIPPLGDLRKHAPRLAKVVELLRDFTSDDVLKWDYFRLSAAARDVEDLLETSGLTDVKHVRCLLHPELVLGSYLLESGLGIAASLAWIELLKHFPRLGKAPEFRWDLPTVLEYAKRLAYAGILYGLEAYGVEVVAWNLADLVLKLLGLRSYMVDPGMEAVRSEVWAPLVEESTKRLASELSGLSRWVAGAWFGLLEAAHYGEIGPSGVQVTNVVDSVGNHSTFTVLPLPIGALLHSLYNFKGEFLDYWSGVLGPILAVLGALIEHALTGVW